MLYFAYGSNLNILQMQGRCPNATPLGSAYFTGWKLVFRGVADIVPASSECLLPVGIWNITEKCLSALDAYEGVDCGLYRREYINGILTYRMNSERISPPAEFYYETIELGYKDFDLDDKYLVEARREAFLDYGMGTRISEIG